MIVILGDGKGAPIHLPAQYIGIYDEFGSLVYAADQLGVQKLRQADVFDPAERKDLIDIVKTNGLPFRPFKEVTSQFDLADGAKVLKAE